MRRAFGDAANRQTGEFIRKAVIYIAVMGFVGTDHQDDVA